MRPISILIFILALGNWAYGQLKQATVEIFISDSLTQFEIKNDSILYVAQNIDLSKYSVKSDTLFLTGGTYQGMFKIIKNNSDTLTILPIRFYKPGIYPMDTIMFVSVKRRIVPIKDFQLLRIDEYGTWGSKRLIINKNREVLYADGGFFLPNDPVTNAISFKLSEVKYRELLDTLAKSLVFMISASKRAPDVFDPTAIDFTFQANGKYFNRKLIGMSCAIHFALYKYLISDIKNYNLVTGRKQMPPPKPSAHKHTNN